MDLDDYFTVGAGGPFRRNEVFTDREQYVELFARRLEDQARERFTAAEFTDFVRPARNVVMLHGEGGIGKSTLLRHICRDFLERESPLLPRHRAAAVVDFADSANQNFETVVLRLRAALGRVHPGFTCFDSGLAVYWERRHPGVPLQEFINRSGFLGEAERSAMAEQVGGVLDELLGTLGIVGTGVRFVGSLGHQLAQTRAIRLARKEFQPFDLLLDETDPERMLSYLPILLGWDLERGRRSTRTGALCVLDTFETVQALPRERGFLEDLLARMVYLMPNVLFVIGGRRPLQWHDPVRSVTLTYGGERRWPRLAGRQGISDQYPLDGFDAAHADLFLRERITTHEGTPAIAEDIRSRIAAASGGSPLYLDLSVSHFRNIVLRGEQPTLADFGSSLPELVLRIMRDLSPEERQLLRAASLLEAFDAEILTSVLPDGGGAAVRRFLEKSFVRRSTGTWPEYRLHEMLRRSINDCDHYTDDGWTTEERRQRLLLAVDHVTDVGLRVWQLGEEEGSATRHNQSAVAATLLALHASLEHGVTPHRLGVLMYTLSQLGHWQVLCSLPEPNQSELPPLRRMVAAARIAADATTDARPRYQAIRALASPVREHPYDDYISYELGALTQSTGAHAAGDRHFSALAEADPLLREAGRWGRAGVALRCSRLAEAATHLPDDHGQPLVRARNQDLLGHVRLHNGEFTGSLELFEATLDHARRVGAPLWAARAARHIALATMWTNPARVRTLLPEARELNEVLGDLIGSAQCDLAACLAAAAEGELDRAGRLLESARRRTDESGVVGQLLPVDAVAVAFHLAGGQRDEALSGARRLIADARDACVSPPVWAAVASLWLDETEPSTAAERAPEERYDFASIGWYGTVDEARTRWCWALRRLLGAG